MGITKKEIPKLKSLPVQYVQVSFVEELQELRCRSELIPEQEGRSVRLER